MLGERIKLVLMDNKLSDEQRRNLQLQILDEIDELCKQNGIKYSLAYGTLLGAVRHHGFIPWDDDVDIMMPYHDMIKFKECLNSELIEFIDADNNNQFEWFFSRIASKKTYSKPGKYIQSYGVNVDLYPIVNVLDDERIIDNYLIEGQRLNALANNSIKWQRRAAKYLSLKTIPTFRHNVLKLRAHVYQYKDESSSIFFSTGGSFKRFNIFDFDFFNELDNIVFEGRQYSAIKEFDKYLSQIYGEYMTPPPEDKRIPYHGGVYYWK